MGAAELTESLCLPAIANIPVGLYVPLLEFNHIDPEQAFTLSINKPANPSAQFNRVTDVVLAIEYEASLA